MFISVHSVKLNYAEEQVNGSSIRSSDTIIRIIRSLISLFKGISGLFFRALNPISRSCFALNGSSRLPVALPWMEVADWGHRCCGNDVQETGSEGDGLDEEDDDAEEDEEQEHEEEQRPPEPLRRPPPPLVPKDTERQLSKKELKKKELAELDAVLAELGIAPKDNGAAREAAGAGEPPSPRGVSGLKKDGVDGFRMLKVLRRRRGRRRTAMGRSIRRVLRRARRRGRRRRRRSLLRRLIRTSLRGWNQPRRRQAAPPPST